MEAVGLRGLEIHSERWDSFSGAASESSAAAFGTRGIAFRAVKRW